MQLITFYYVWKLALDFNVYKMWRKNGYRKVCILWILFRLFIDFDANVIKCWSLFNRMRFKSIGKNKKKIAVFSQHSHLHARTSWAHRVAIQFKWRIYLALAPLSCCRLWKHAQYVAAGTSTLVCRKYNENCNKTINYTGHYRKWTNKIMLTACNMHLSSLYSVFGLTIAWL